MLTKDLLRYKIQKGQIYPQFVDPTNSKLLKVAEQLITVFENAIEDKRSTLLEGSKVVIDGTSESPIISRGLEKLLLDRTEFDTTPNEELIAFRSRLFTETSRILSQEQFQDYTEYHQRVLGLIANDSGLPETELHDQLYADLPSCQEVLSFRRISPEHLLHRYNTAQVQGLLLHCNSLSLRLTDSMTAELRQLFKYLRFHQLLSTIRKVKTDTGEIFQITVDGPLNLFYKTKRYGMNLANFFVAVLHQQKWEVTAEIQFRNKRASQLSIDDSCGIKPISQQFLAYIPEDIQYFQQMLQNKTDEWQIQPGSQFFPLPGETYCFPDYQLIHSSGAEVAIELFHPWHQGHLLNRLNSLSNKTDIPLIIGVSKELEKNPTIAEAIETSPYFSHYGFIFRDIPTMGTLLPILNSIVSE